MKTPRPEDNPRFCLRAETAIEDFGPRSLVLLCDALRLREINAGSRKILALLDGKRTVRDIAALLASSGATPEVVAEALREMERHGIVGRAGEWKKKRPENMNEAKYLADPDVSFRPEDDGGGILYSVETDSLEVVNPVAAEIWTYLAAPRTRAEIVEHLCAACEGAARAPVEKDVADFVESLLKKGFIGVVEESA